MRKYFILFILFLMTGCWNYRELNEYAIATGMAIDYTDGKYEISLLFANGKNTEKTEESNVMIASEKGNTIYEGIKNISLSTPKKINISHLSVIIVSEDIARNGITPVLDYLLREPDSHQNFYIVISKNNKAKDILSILTPLSDFPSQNITSSIKTNELEQAKVFDSSFTLFVSNLLKKGINPITNSIILVGDKNEGSKKEEQKNSIVGAYTKLDTLAIFKKDKLVDWATYDESIGLNMLLGNIKTLYINIPCEEKNMIISSSSYKVTNEVKKNKITVNIKANGIINESGCNVNIRNIDEIKNIEQKVEDKMNEYVNKIIIKTKKLKTDIFGYGNMIYKKYPRYFNSIENWDNEFENLDIEINIDFSLNNNGALSQTIGFSSK